MSRLTDAFERAATTDRNYAKALGSEIVPRGLEDAKALGQALAGVRVGPRVPGKSTSDLYALAAVFQAVRDRETAEALREHALPSLIDAFDRAVESGADERDLVFILKMFAMYPTDAGLKRIVSGAHSFPKGFLWSVVFGVLQKDPEAFEEVSKSLRSRLPSGFAGIAYLDACNNQAREGRMEGHPFDSPEGHGLLRQWMDGPDESYAHSVTAAIPFISGEARSTLIEAALACPHLPVQMEAAWACGRLGDPNAVARLVGWCDRPQTYWRAAEYLKQLGFEDQVPGVCAAPEFQALAAMCQWLEHPNEFGEAPDEVKVADSRELHWPPTGDRRRMFAIQYLYRAGGGREKDDRGYGLVGSETFALFGEATESLTPLEVYALHCCWELETNKDPRAPAKRSVEAGLALLREHNPGLA